MRSLLTFAIAISSWLTLVQTGEAVPIFNDRTAPVDIQSGPETSLQGIFEGLFGDLAPNVQTDQQNLASFRPTSATVFTLLEGIAGYRSTNLFSIYEVNDRAERVVFDGSAANGDEVAGAFSASAQQTDFLWLLDVYKTGNRMWSDDSRNQGLVPQVLAFVGTGQPFLNATLGVDGTFDANDIIIAFEDLNRSISGRSDDDFNDLVILIENVGPGQEFPEPVFDVSLPEPTSVVVWAMLMGTLFSFRRRKRV